MNNHISISTHFCGMRLESCIYNAAGCLCTTSTDLNNLNNSDSGAILTKSSTIEPREGNKPPKFHINSNNMIENILDNVTGDVHGNMSINANGLENQGYKFYTDYFGTSANKTNTKPYIISIAGMKPGDNVIMVENILKSIAEGNSAISAIELNPSCPNIVGKTPLCFDHGTLSAMLHDIQDIRTDISVATGVNIPLGLKLPPFFTRADFESIRDIIIERDINFINCINSIPKGLWIDPHESSPVIAYLGGIGGGDFMRRIMLSNVYQFRQLLPDLPIIGCGGIYKGEHVVEAIMAGATVVQVGTQLTIEGTDVFTRLNSELKEFMNEKKYGCLDDIPTINF